MISYRRPTPASLDLQAKLNSDKYSGNFIKHVSAKDLTLRYVQDHGFTGPLVVSDKTGLGLRVPNHVISATDIAKYAKESCPAVILGADRYDPPTTTIGDWSSRYSKAAFEGSENLQALPPAVRIEFSNTLMARHVDAPRLVRQIDWLERAWPKDLKPPSSSATDSTYPKLQKYCIIAMRNCYERFTTGAGGSSTWFHVLRGKIVLWLLPPLESNLDMYERWVASGRQENYFLGDAVEECQRFSLDRGKTLFLPSGWIYAMFLADDTLAFHGSFIHSFAVSMQHRVWEIENRFWMSLSTYPFFEDIHWYVLERYVHCLTGRSFLAKNVSDDENSQFKIGSAQLSWGTGQLTEYYVVEPEKKGLRDLVAWLSLKRRSDNVPPAIVNPKGLLLAGEELGARLEKEDLRGARGSGCDRKAFMLRWPDDDEDEETIQYFKPQQSQNIVSPPQSVGGARGCLSSKSLASSGSSSAAPLRVLADSAAKTQQPSFRGGDAAAAAAVTARFMASHSGSRTVEGHSLPGAVSSYTLGDSCCDGSGSCNNTALRKNGCGKCEPCSRDNCGECICCQDMPKFGGSGRLKQACLQRRCVVLAQSKMENGYKDASALKGSKDGARAVITSSDSKNGNAGRGVATKVSDSCSNQAADRYVKLCPKGVISVSSIPPSSTEPSDANSKRPCRQASMGGHHGQCPCCFTDSESGAQSRNKDRPFSASNCDQSSTCSEAKRCNGPGKVKIASLARQSSSSAGNPCKTAEASGPRDLATTVDASKQEREAATRRQKSDNSDKRQTKIEVGATLLTSVNNASIARPVSKSNSSEKSLGVLSGFASVLAKPQNKPEVEKKHDFLSTITLRVVSSDQAAARNGMVGTAAAVQPTGSTSLLVADPHRTCVTGGDIPVKQHSLDDARHSPAASVPFLLSKTVAMSTESHSATVKRKTAFERCHECDGCKRPNCGRCGYCRDMKKNGGPGKMRKACVDRRCTQFSGAAASAGDTLMTGPSLSAVLPTPDQQCVPSSSSLLLSMTNQQLMSVTSLVPAPTAAKQLRAETPSPVTSAVGTTALPGPGAVASGSKNARARTSTSSGATDAAATVSGVKLSVNKVLNPRAKSVKSHVSLQLRSQERCLRCEGCRSKNCGSCVRCRDMKQFGGPGRLKKACFSRTCTGMNNLTTGTASPPASDQVLASGRRSTVVASTNTRAAASTTTRTAACTTTAAPSSTTRTVSSATRAVSTTTSTATASTTTTTKTAASITTIAATPSPNVPSATGQQPNTVTLDVHAPKYKPAARAHVSEPAQGHSIGCHAAPSTRLSIPDTTTVSASRSAASASNDLTHAAGTKEQQHKTQWTAVLGRSTRKRRAPDSALTSSTNPKLPKKQHPAQPKHRTLRGTDGASMNIEHAAVDGLPGPATVHSSLKQRHGVTKNGAPKSGSAASSIPAAVVPIIASGKSTASILATSPVGASVKSLSVLKHASRPKGDGPKDTGIFIPSSEEVHYRGEAEKRQASEPAAAVVADCASSSAVSVLHIEASPVQQLLQQHQLPNQQVPTIAVGASTVAATDAAAACSPPSPRKRLLSDSAAVAKSDNDSSSPQDRRASTASSPAKRPRMDRAGRGVSCKLQCCVDLLPASRHSSSSAFTSHASTHTRGRASAEPAADLQEEQHRRLLSVQCDRSPDAPIKHQPKKQKELPASANSDGHAEQSLTGNCGKCPACRDMKCFGGSGKLKKACATRKTLLTASSTVASAAKATPTLKLTGLASMVTRNNSAAPAVKRPAAVSSHVNAAVTRLDANVASSSVSGTKASATTVNRKAIRK